MEYMPIRPKFFSGRLPALIKIKWSVIDAYNIFREKYYNTDIYTQILSKGIDYLYQSKTPKLNYT